MTGYDQGRSHSLGEQHFVQTTANLLKKQLAALTSFAPVSHQVHRVQNLPAVILSCAAKWTSTCLGDVLPLCCHRCFFSKGRQLPSRYHKCLEEPQSALLRSLLLLEITPERVRTSLSFSELRWFILLSLTFKHSQHTQIQHIFLHAHKLPAYTKPCSFHHWLCVNLILRSLFKDESYMYF